MAALPDTYMPEGPLRHQRQVPQHHIETDDTGPMRQFALRFAGFSMLVAAGGLWLIPAIEGDAAMQLLKLAISAALAIIGGLLLGGHGTPIGPEVHVDPAARSLTIIERGEDGRVASQVSHDIDALGDIIVRDDLLTARCTSEQTLVTLPVTDPRVKAVLMRMLATRPA